MNNIEQFEDKKAALMYFHTSLRNVGLFTTLSFGAFGYSRYYRDKIQFYNLILIFIGLVLLSIAFLLNFYLHNDMLVFVQNNEDSDVAKWLLVNQVIFGVHSILFLLGLITLMRNFKK